eukprot:2825459-Alexandrium_andersonii.AAC.1
MGKGGQKPGKGDSSVANGQRNNGGASAGARASGSGSGAQLWTDKAGQEWVYIPRKQPVGSWTCS